MAEEVERRKSTNDMVNVFLPHGCIYLVVSLLLEGLFDVYAPVCCMCERAREGRVLSPCVDISIPKLISLQVFIYGGVGPLHSDVTVAGVAKAFGVRLVCNIDLLDPSAISCCMT